MEQALRGIERGSWASEWLTPMPNEAVTAFEGAFNELANPMLVKRYGAALTPEELSKMATGAAQAGITPSRHGGWD